jgi:hypothetical protein
MLCAEDLKRHQRLLKRQRAIWAYKQIAISLILVLFRRTIWVLTCFRDLLSISFSRIGVMAHALGLSLKEVVQQTRPQVLVRLSFEETVLDGAGTRHHQLQDRICGLDARLRNGKAGAQPVAPKAGRIDETRQYGSPVWSSRNREASSFAKLPGPNEGKALVSALGVMTITLITAGAVRATIPSPPTEAPMAAPLKGPGSSRLAVSTHERSAPPPALVSGFSVLLPTAAPEPLPLPPRTIAQMMLVNSPLAIGSAQPHTMTAPITKTPIAVKPKLKARPKPKLATREPQKQLPWLQPPWWRQLPWIQR